MVSQGQARLGMVGQSWCVCARFGELCQSRWGMEFVLCSGKLWSGWSGRVEVCYGSHGVARYVGSR